MKVLVVLVSGHFVRRGCCALYRIWKNTEFFVQCTFCFWCKAFCKTVLCSRASQTDSHPAKHSQPDKMYCGLHGASIANGKWKYMHQHASTRFYSNHMFPLVFDVFKFVEENSRGWLCAGIPWHGWNQKTGMMTTSRNQKRRSRTKTGTPKPSMECRKPCQWQILTSHFFPTMNCLEVAL